MRNDVREYGSFRDPSGFIFYKNDSIYRQINKSYRENYDFLISSNLYDALVKEHLLIPHMEVDVEGPSPENEYKVIKPKKIPFISYPYEWCFSQLKDAALCMLSIQKKALEYGMSLKDSNAYNIQFLDGKPILIDTLSVEKYKEGQPWIGYRQFCQHFLAPLALMSLKDIRLNQLSRVFIDGIPLGLARKILPIRSYVRFSLFSHIYIHSKYQKAFSNKTAIDKNKKMGRFGMLGLLDNLESAVNKLNWYPGDTEWNNYYDETNYSGEALQKKKEIVTDLLDRIKPSGVWDIGANTGAFSRIASEKGIETISFDIDPSCVEKNYLESKQSSQKKILPLLLDLTNPSPGLGWQHNERMSILERGPVDTVLALALIHHLAISNNLPLIRIASFFADIGKSLIIEFVPKEDSQVQKLISTREDIFVDYSRRSFEESFMKYFKIIDSIPIEGTVRILYLMEKADGE
ncbi:SAM-dependent methyltransferase [Thermodesulfobacteriota bacterium]